MNVLQKFFNLNNSKKTNKINIYLIIKQRKYYFCLDFLKLIHRLKKFLFKHQIKKKFQYSLEWEKNQLAIWDNRSMLHQATPFRGDRIMHRITIY